MQAALVLESFADAVDRQYDPELDGVDGEDPRERRESVPARTASGLHVVRTLFSSTAAQTAQSIVVPFPGNVGQGDAGDAVFAIKRAYARSVSGFRLRQLMSKPLAVRRAWGKQFSDEFGQTVYTRQRHTLLAPYYDAYALQLLRSAAEPEPSPRDLQIARQLAWHTALYNRRYQVPYSQARPSQLYRPELITRGDCSGSIAGGCAWANILPRVDWRYTNTWIQSADGFGGQLVSGIASARPGDVIFYGSPGHEALYLGDGLIWSFGSYPIKILRSTYRSDFHSIRRFVP